MLFIAFSNLAEIQTADSAVTIGIANQQLAINPGAIRGSNEREL
jgi:hypothetical protein